MSASSPSRPRRASAAGPPKWKELLSPEQKQKNKLPEAAALILKNHNKNDPTYPSLEKRRELLAQIKEIPGAEWYTMHSVRDWFRHRRPPTGYEEKEEESSDEEEPQAVSETGKILQPSPSAAKVRVMKNRLPEAATSILQNHFKNEPVYPPLTKRKALLAEVHKVPGAEWYKLSDINQWLNTRLKRKRDDSDDEALRETDKILWPSLSASKIRNLEKLLRETPNPSAIHLQIWSRSLGAEQLHVESWVQLHRAQAQQPQPLQPALQLQGPSQPQHDPSALPTPEGTASPELNSPRINTIPSLASPISSPIFQQTYIGYGVPAHIGVGGSGPQTYAALGTSFMAVQPSTSSSSAYLAPYTPTSPIAAPSPGLAQSFATRTRAESPESGREDDGEKLRAPTPVAAEEPPFMEALLPPDTPSEANEDEEEVDELAETEGPQGSREPTEVPMEVTSTPSDHPLSEQPNTAVDHVTSLESTTAQFPEHTAVDSSEEFRPLPQATISSPAVELKADDLQELSYERDSSGPDAIDVEESMPSAEPRSPPSMPKASREEDPSPMDVDVDDHVTDLSSHSHSPSPPRAADNEEAAIAEHIPEPTSVTSDQVDRKPPACEPHLGDHGGLESPSTSPPSLVQSHPVTSTTHTTAEASTFAPPRVHLRFSSPILPTDLPTPTSTSKPTPKTHQSPLTGKRRQKQTQKQKEREKLRFLRMTQLELPSVSSASASGLEPEGAIGTNRTEAIVANGTEFLGTNGAETVVTDAIILDVPGAIVTDAPEEPGTASCEETSTEEPEVSGAGPSESEAGELPSSSVTPTKLPPSPTSASEVQLRSSSPIFPIDLPSTSRPTPIPTLIPTPTPTPTPIPKPSPLAGTPKSILNQNFGQKEKQDRKEKEKRKARQKLRFLKSIALSESPPPVGTAVASSQLGHEAGAGSEAIGTDAPEDRTALYEETRTEEPEASRARPSTPKPEGISVDPPATSPHRPHGEALSPPIPATSTPVTSTSAGPSAKQEQQQGPIPVRIQPKASSRLSSPFVPNDLLQNSDDDDMDGRQSKRQGTNSLSEGSGIASTTFVVEPSSEAADELPDRRRDSRDVTTLGLLASSSSRSRESRSPSNLLMEEDEALERLLSEKVEEYQMECDVPLSTSATPLPEPPTEILPPLPTLFPRPAEASEIDPPPPSTIPATLASHPPPQPPRSLFHDLCTIVLSNTPSTPTPPSTSWEELGQCMDDCVRFYEAIEGGVYESFGLVPSKRVSSEFEGEHKLESGREEGEEREEREIEEGEIAEEGGEVEEAMVVDG